MSYAAHMEDFNYFNDSRVVEAAIGRGRVVEESMTVEFEAYIEDDEGESEITVSLPAEFVVCHVCEGRGNHVNPSIDSSGLTSEDFDEDPDFYEDYMGGRYDVQCGTCKGLRVVIEARRKGLDDAQKANLALYDEYLQGQYDDLAESAAERRMGA